MAIEAGRLPGDQCGGAGQPACFSPPPEDQVAEELNPGKGVRETVLTIINYFLSFVGLIAVIALIWSGFLWVTSGGDDERYEKGKKGVLYALLGIILILLSYAIVSFVIGAGKGEVPTADGGTATPGGGGTGGTQVPGGQSTPDNILNDNLAMLNSIRNAINPRDPQSVARFQDALAKIYNAVPHTVEIDAGYNNTLASLAAWVADPDSTAKKSAFISDGNYFISLVRDFPRMNSLISARPVSGEAPLYIYLDGSLSTDPTKTTIPDQNYHWSYVDNSGQTVDLGTGPVKNITFEEPGNFAVRLTVETVQKDANGAKMAIDGTSIINIRVLPANSFVDFKINGEEVLSIYKVALMDATKGLSFLPVEAELANGRQIKEWFWDFGDGIIESRTSAESITHAYGKTGKYSVRLTLVDNLNEKKYKEVALYVQNSVVNIRISPKKGTIIDTFTFDGSGSKVNEGIIKSYAWQITGPDTVESSDASFSYHFTKPGIYEAKLTIEDSKGESSSDSTKFTVYSQAPLASFVWSLPQESSPATIFFDASRSSDPDGDSLLYSWDFDGDGTYDVVNSAEPTATYTFSKEGIFNVKLKVADPFIQEDTLEKAVNIKSTLNVDFTAASTIVYVGQEVIFNAVSSQAIGFLWDFGDGTREVATQVSKAHTFAKEGKYRVRLTVTDNKDRQNFVEKWLYVGERDQPIAVAEVKKNTFSLMPIKDFCGSGKDGFSVSRADYLTLDSIESINSDGSKSGLKIKWDFHDGVYSTDQAIRHRFSEVTKESCTPITLTVSDAEKGKSASETLYFQVKNAPPAFDRFLVRFIENKKETPVNVYLEAAGAHDPDGQIVQYKWWAEAETDPTEKMDLHTTKDNFSGITILPRGMENQINRWRFFVELKDNNGETVTNDFLFGKSIFLDVKNGKNLAPIVDFRMDKTSIKMGDTITFTADAKDPQFQAIPQNAYKWDFDGDNFFDDTSSGASATYKFTAPGEYDVRLKVVYRGLATSKTHKVYVERTAKLPLAAFTYQVAGKKVAFDATNSQIDTSIAGNTLDLAWDLDTAVDTNGDGVPNNDVDSKESKLSFTYPEEKTYRVRLAIKDKSLGEDFVERDIMIRKAGQVVAGGAATMEKTLGVTANSLMTSLVLVAPNKNVVKNGTVDILTFIENADGSPYYGTVEFTVLEGSATILPATVKAMNGQAASTLQSLGEGRVLIRVVAHGTVSGEISETIVIMVE